MREAADSTGQLAQALRNRSVGDLVSGVEDFAQRQPVAFFGATVLAGFALARFVKAPMRNNCFGSPVCLPI